MSMQFFPVGILISGSYAVSASYTTTTSLGGVPSTASIAEFALTPIGPTGPSYKTISGSDVTIYAEDMGGA